MGAENFVAETTAATAREAFNALREEAQDEYGSRGYTGTIAEKDAFIELTVPAGVTAGDFIEWAWATIDPYGEVTPEEIPAEHRALAKRAGRILDDKYGPALCVKVAEGRWRFEGYAAT